MPETYWGKFFDTYDKNQAYVVGKNLLDEIKGELNRLPDLGALLEFGCGSGYFTETIVARSRSVIATDLSDRLLQAAGARLQDHPTVMVQRENCMASSFASGKFDSVFMANLIHVIEHPVKALQESHRILRRGGCLVIVTFTGHDMRLWEKIKMGARFVRAWGKPPEHTHSFSPGMLKPC